MTTYERNPKYRKQAIAIHGDSCFACGFNFGDFYGEYAEGYIHVHHTVPVSEFELPKKLILKLTSFHYAQIVMRLLIEKKTKQTKKKTTPTVGKKKERKKETKEEDLNRR